MTGRDSRETDYAARDTALLFVDMQAIFCTPGADPGHPDMGPDHPYHVRLRETVVPNQRRLLAAARTAGVQVIHTIIQALTEDGRDISLDHRLSGILVPKGHPMGGVIDALAPVANEIVLPKTSSGVFNSTSIDYVLRNLGVRRLIVAGVVTDQCVDMAVRDAADRGYLVSVPEDASATHSDDHHRAALAAFGGYAWITDTATVLARLAAAPRG
ncbi:MAG: cysteine hydrolase family protein [Gemmobacter sp.]